MQSSWKLTRNQDLNALHVANASTFVADLDVRVITGDTLVFDFVYFLHPVSHACSSLPLIDSATDRQGT